MTTSNTPSDTPDLTQTIDDISREISERTNLRPGYLSGMVNDAISSFGEDRSIGGDLSYPPDMVELRNLLTHPAVLRDRLEFLKESAETVSQYDDFRLRYYHYDGEFIRILDILGVNHDPFLTPEKLEEFRDIPRQVTIRCYNSVISRIGYSGSCKPEYITFLNGYFPFERNPLLTESDKLAIRTSLETKRALLESYEENDRKESEKEALIITLTQFLEQAEDDSKEFIDKEVFEQMPFGPWTGLHPRVYFGSGNFQSLYQRIYGMNFSGKIDRFPERMNQVKVKRKYLKTVLRYWSIHYEEEISKNNNLNDCRNQKLILSDYISWKSGDYIFTFFAFSPQEAEESLSLFRRLREITEQRVQYLGSITK